MNTRTHLDVETSKRLIRAAEIAVDAIYGPSSAATAEKFKEILDIVRKESPFVDRWIDIDVRNSTPEVKREYDQDYQGLTRPNGGRLQRSFEVNAWRFVREVRDIAETDSLIQYVYNIPNMLRQMKTFLSWLNPEVSRKMQDFMGENYDLFN